MPPTPVAAPWNGSTALGWLWLSTFMTIGEAVADVDRAGVLLARAERAPAAPSVGKRRSSGLRVLVAAVLAPHAADDPELERVRVAPEAPADLLVLGAGQRDLAQGRVVGLGGVRCDRGSGDDAVAVRVVMPPPSRAGTARRRGRPSPPSSASDARSGCGMSATTLRRSSQMPAMPATDPFGLAAGGHAPVRVAVAEDDAAARPRAGQQRPAAAW